MEQGIEQLNSLPYGAAAAVLTRCCGSRAWACELARRRPFRDVEELLRAADDASLDLNELDWLDAFRSHPKIGEREAAAGQTQVEKAWSADEQSGVGAAGGEARAELARLNREYEEKFGHIFIVCATGKTADEILALLRERLRNDAGAELRVAAEEQRRITHLRLRKLLAR
jgi:OHCU decarboxylase